MTKPDLMAKLAAYELVMVSGVSPQNNVSYGFFRNAAQAGAVGMLLIEADRRDNPEWTDFKVTHHAELEAVVRDAARYRWLRDVGTNDRGWDVLQDHDYGMQQLHMFPDQLDEALDTAMRAGEG